MLLDNAQSLVSGKIPEPAQEQIERRILRALTECARLGMTTVHDAGVPQSDIDAYHSLAAKGQLPMRVYVMVAAKSDALAPWLARGPEIGDYVTVRAVKLISDGALGSRGAAMIEPYSDDPATAVSRFWTVKQSATLPAGRWRVAFR